MFHYIKSKLSALFRRRTSKPQSVQPTGNTITIPPEAVLRAIAARPGRRRYLNARPRAMFSNRFKYQSHL